MVSMTGSQVSRVAYPLLVFSLGGSASTAGLVSAAALVPYIVLGIPAGVLVDRWNRKAIMIACDVGRFLTLLSIPLAATLGPVPPIQLVVAVALDSGFYVLFNAAQIAALPRIVGTDQVASALTQDQAALHTALLAGPPLGGYLFQSLGRTAPFLLDALSYGVSALALLFIRTELQDSPPQRAGPLLPEMGQGIAWLWNHPVARSLTLSTAVIFFAGNGSYLILVVLARHLGATAAGVGVVVAAGSVGGLLGSALSNPIARRLSFRSIVAGTVWLQALLLPLYIFAPTPLALALIASGIALVEAAADPVRYGYQIGLMPDALRGRINSAASTVVFVPMWLGSAAAGLLLDRFGSAAAVSAFAALLIAPALLLSASRDIRQIGKVSPPT
jgi:predicted MFS family arabinose efflux permease